MAHITVLFKLDAGDPNETIDETKDALRSAIDDYADKYCDENNWYSVLWGYDRGRVLDLRDESCQDYDITESKAIKSEADVVALARELRRTNLGWHLHDALPKGLQKNAENPLLEELRGFEKLVNHVVEKNKSKSLSEITESYFDSGLFDLRQAAVQFNLASHPWTFPCRPEDSVAINLANRDSGEFSYVAVDIHI